jgi:hypothetical protein
VKLVVGVSLRAQDDRVDQFDAELAAGVSPSLAQLGGPHALESEKAIDTARLPVSRIAAVHEHDRVQVAG